MYGATKSHDFDEFMQPEERAPGLIDFKEPLELKDQHLVALANHNGYLAGRVVELEKTNDYLRSALAKQYENNGDLLDRNKELETSAAAAQAGYKSGSQLVEEIENALSKKVSKS